MILEAKNVLRSTMESTAVAGLCRASKRKQIRRRFYPTLWLTHPIMQSQRSQTCQAQARIQAPNGLQSLQLIRIVILTDCNFNNKFCLHSESVLLRPSACRRLTMFHLNSELWRIVTRWSECSVAGGRL